jgi:hypothetical protein
MLLQMKNSNKIAGKNGEKSEDGAPCWWYCWGTAFRVQGAFPKVEMHAFTNEK